MSDGNSMKFLIIMIGLLTVSCGNNDKKEKFRVVRSINEVINKVSFNDSVCNSFNIPNVSFSIEVRKEYEIQFNYSPGVAFRLRKMYDDTLVNELSFGTILFNPTFTKRQEKVWFEEFRNSSGIKSNPDFKMMLLNGLKLKNATDTYYVIKYNPELTEYYENSSLMSLGVIIPNANGDKGIVVVVSKPYIDLKDPLTPEEKRMLESLVFENF